MIIRTLGLLLLLGLMLAIAVLALRARRRRRVRVRELAADELLGLQQSVGGSCHFCRRPAVSSVTPHRAGRAAVLACPMHTALALQVVTSR